MDIPEKLVFKARLCDSKINYCHFDTNFREIVRVGHLGGHIEPKLVTLCCTMSKIKCMLVPT